MPSGLSVAKACRSRLVWGLGDRTLYRTTLKTGDRALIYIAGARECRQSFVAEAAIAGQVQAIPLEIGPRRWTSTIRLADFHWFERPVHIHPILARLEFIPDPQNKKWGSILQGAVLRITQRDYDLITSAGQTAALQPQSIALESSLPPHASPLTWPPPDD